MILTIPNLLIAENFRVRSAWQRLRQGRLARLSPQCFLLHKSAFWRERVAAMASDLS
jgi:hypothetical protein